jgi:hypothetical protein
MKDPERLADRPPSALARSLLAGAYDEEPPRSLLDRTMTTVSTAGAQASVGAASTSAASSVAGTLAKYLGLGAVAGALATGGAFELSRGAPQAVSQPQTAPAALGEPTPGAHAAEGAALPEPAAPERPISPSELPLLGVTGPLPTVAREQAAPPDHADTLREEALVIDRAREAVATGNASGALRALDDYRLRFEKPAFQPEALYLRMQALRLRGDERAAREFARQLLVAYPNGAQAASARAFLKAEP